jgi:hypothetical protein
MPLPSSMCATCPAHLILLDITRYYYSYNPSTDNTIINSTSIYLVLKCNPVNIYHTLNVLNKYCERKWNVLCSM